MCQYLAVGKWYDYISHQTQMNYIYRSVTCLYWKVRCSVVYRPCNEVTGCTL